MTNTDKPSVLMVRLPIFRQDLKIVAYELCLDGDPSDSTLFDPDKASSQLLLNTYTSLHQDGSIQRVPLFIPITGEMLLKGYTPDLPANQVVLQLPANLKVGATIAANVRALAEKGYRMAVDSFALQAPLIPLLKHMKIVKIDIREQSPARLAQMVRVLIKAGINPLAQHIQTFEQLGLCKRCGFRLFQGPFISRPVAVKGKQLPGSSIALLELVHTLQRPSTTASEVEALIQLDPVLTYRILRVVNSAAYNLDNTIDSLSQAIVLLGLDQIRKWATLIVLSGQEGQPEELSRNLLVRGRLCQLIAEQQGELNPDSSFMVGVMSQLDVLMGMEMVELLEQIPLDDEIKLAIAEHGGALGNLLRQVILYEQGEFKTLKEESYDSTFFEVAYQHSLSWANSAMAALADA